MESIIEYNSLFKPKHIKDYIIIGNNKCTLINGEKTTNFETQFKGKLIISGVYLQEMFLMIDILSKNGIVINPYDISYETRFVILNSVYNRLKVENLNIGIHPNLSSNYTKHDILNNIFTNNFKYKNNIVQGEKLVKIKKKIVKNEKLSQIYNVHDIESNNNEGLLYLKTCQDVFKFENDYIQSKDKIFECIYDKQFEQWKLVC